MDSDEEEMAAMRSSARHAGQGRQPAPTAEPEKKPARTTAQARSSAPMPTAEPQAPDSDSDDVPNVPDAMHEMGFVSFGKKKVERKVDPNVHQTTARPRKQVAGSATKGGVQFGPRVVDAATKLGASERATAGRTKGSTIGPVVDKTEVVSSAPPANDPRDFSGDAREDVTYELGSELPVSHEVHISAHEKAVTALGFDPKAARMVTGSMDGAVKFFDFAGMSEAKESFRTVEPVDGHMVQAISFGPSGSCLLVACSDSHCRIYDRDGSSKPIQITVRGDMYVRDMQHTKGHTQMLTGGQWHPLHAEHWVSSSLDGTLRIWDLNAHGVGMDRMLPSLHVLKTIDKRNCCVGGAAGRAGGLHPCCVIYSPNDGRQIVGGCSDGSVQVFNEKARYSKPDKILRTAHAAQVTGLSFIKQGTTCNLLATRGLDDKMKIWDTRMMSDAKGPVKCFDSLPTGHEKAGLCASPDGRFLVTGTPAESKGGSASVHIFDTKDWSNVCTLDFGKRAALRFAWPQELDQLVIGSSTGEVVMLYNPEKSRKGAMHFVGRRARAKTAIEQGDMTGMPIFNMTDPAEIQKFYATGHGNMTKIRRSEARHGQKTLTPVRPPTSEGNMAAQSDSMAFAAMVIKAGAKQLNLQKASGQEPDAQKALLSYQDRAQKDAILVERAYLKNQPEKLLDWSVDESEGDKRMSSKMKGDFCRKCGQKVCRCVDYSKWGQKKPRTA